VSRRKTIPITRLRDYYNLIRLFSPKTQESILDDFLRGKHVGHLIDIYRESKKHFSRYENVKEPFKVASLKETPSRSRVITSTRQVTAILEEEPFRDLVNNKSLNFEYLDREFSPIRTTHARKDTGASGKGSGHGGVDFIARNLRYDLPVLGEIKVNNDQTPFLGLIQLLTYLSELTTRNQRKRLRRWEPFTDPVSPDAPFYLYILSCHTRRKPNHWKRMVDKSKLLSARLKRGLPDDIADIAFLEMSPRTLKIRKL
jgi:hypothetical protein